MVESSIKLAAILLHLSLVSSLPHFSTSSFVHPTRLHLAFVEKTDIVSTAVKFKCSMSASASSSGMTDAEAYHEMVSAAVDLTSVYVRNGIVSGKSTSNSMASVKLVAFTPLSIFFCKQPDLFETLTPIHAVLSCTTYH